MKKFKDKLYRDHFIGLTLTLGISIVACLILILRDGWGYLYSVILAVLPEWLFIMVTGAIWGYCLVVFRRHSLLWILCGTFCALLGVIAIGALAIKLAELNWWLLLFVAFSQQVISSGISIMVLELKHLKNKGGMPENYRA